MKIVVISQRVDEIKRRNEIRDAIDHRLIKFVERSGGIAVPVPNVLVEHGQLDAWLGIINPDAFILSGGNDIGSCDNRDDTELALLNFAETEKLPLLGICRGMQMMARWAGAELKSVGGHVRTRHSIFGELDGCVNSFHNKSVASLPSCFRIMARSADYEIEAIRHNTLPWQGWMWHPEREEEFCKNDVNRFSKLLSCEQ